MKILLTIVCVGCAVFYDFAHGQQVFKCASEAGTLTFSDKPCGDAPEEIYLSESQSGISSINSYQVGNDSQTSLNDSSNLSNKSRLTSTSEARLRTLESRLDSVRRERARQSPYVSSESKQKLYNQEKSIQREIDSIRGYSPQPSTNSERVGDNQSFIAVSPHPNPIPSTSGGFYQPVAGGYMAPDGNTFCPKVAGGIICNGNFIPTQ